MISIKNVILPNKPLNNFELEEAAKDMDPEYKCHKTAQLCDLHIY